MDDKVEIEEFSKHELMDRAFMVMEILGMLKDHPAHTGETRKAFNAADTAMAEFYARATDERFKDVE